MPESDVEAIRARVESLALEMRPKTEAGALLISQMAILSVRMERAAEHETAAIAHRVRHAAGDFDEERYDLANALFDQLADDPRTILRKLRKSPEGVEKLVDAWSDLLADLASGPWTDEQLEQAAHLIGLKSRHAQGSRLGVLNWAIRGDFAGLGSEDGAGLSETAREAWAKGQLFDRIEAEVVALEEHYQTLDFETIAIDRAEAGARALFDTSKPACLARRYEGEARRGFFRALKEFRLVEAAPDVQAEPTRTPPAPAADGLKMGSFRQTTPPPPGEPGRPDPGALLTRDLPIPDAQGRPLVFVPPVKTPG